jgi:hypothetical protein
MFNSKVNLEKATADTLRDKAKDHNDSVGGAKGKRTSAGVLQQVYNRGIGAYKTNPSSVRPNVSSKEQWAMGRVNGFLHALKTGNFKRGSFDTDLLPNDHPLSSNKVKKHMPGKHDQSVHGKGGKGGTGGGAGGGGTNLSPEKNKQVNSLAIDLFNHGQKRPVRSGPKLDEWRKKGRAIVDQASSILKLPQDKTITELRSRMGE